MKIKQPSKILFIFILISILIRLFSFFPSVIDHDESTYLIIAREINEGKNLYIDAWDTKPPGIYILFSAWQSIFGYSVFNIRIFASIFVALTAFFLYMAYRTKYKNNLVGFISGLIYIFTVSVYKYCLAANTEIFFNLFTAAALLIFLNARYWYHYVLMGLVIGYGINIKYVALADLGAMLTVYFFMNIFKPDKNKLKIFLNCFCAFTASLVPLLTVFLFSFFSSNTQEMFDVIFNTTGRYINTYSISSAFIYFLKFYIYYSPVVGLCAVSFIYHLKLKDKNRFILKFFILWFIFVWIVVLLPGKEFDHYYIQLLLPLSFFAPSFLLLKSKLKSFLLSRKRLLLIIPAAALIIIMAYQKVKYFDAEDIPYEITDYLSEQLTDKDTIFTGNYQHIIYYLLDKTPPTKYIHPTLLTKEDHIRTLGINPEDEFKMILDKDPLFIIIKDKFPSEIVNNTINTQYYLDKIFSDNVYLYKRKD